jgi:hypothetical protein
LRGPCSLKRFAPSEEAPGLVDRDRGAGGGTGRDGPAMRLTRPTNMRSLAERRWLDAPFRGHAPAPLI